MQAWATTKIPKVLAGNAFISALSSLALSGRALLLCSDRYLKNGTIAEIKSKLSLVKLTIHAQSINNPDIVQIKEMVTKYQDNDFELIIGLGGGSIIDTAKTLSVLLSDSDALGILDALAAGEKPEIQDSIPCIAIPSTSGTGAEVTQFATIWDHENKHKYSLESFLMQAQIIILDPSLTISLPFEQTLFTALDALSHAVESLWNKSYNPLAISCAKEAIFLICHYLPFTLQNLENLEARARLQTASFLAGIAISHTKTAIAHAISYPLTYTYAVPHGLACSFTIAQTYHHLKSQDCLPMDIMNSLQQAVTLLSSLDLSRYLQKYLSLPELKSLLPEMNNPQRFGNFIIEVGPDTLSQIVLDSY